MVKNQFLNPSDSNSRLKNTQVPIELCRNKQRVHCKYVYKNSSTYLISQTETSLCDEHLARNVSDCPCPLSSSVSVFTRLFTRCVFILRPTDRRPISHPTEAPSVAIFMAPSHFRLTYFLTLAVSAFPTV